MRPGRAGRVTLGVVNRNGFAITGRAEPRTAGGRPKAGRRLAARAFSAPKRGTSKVRLTLAAAPGSCCGARAASVPGSP